MTTIHFLLPPSTVLNQNQRLHRMVKARHTKYLRTLARRKSHGLTWLVSQGESRRHAAARVGWNDYHVNRAKILQRKRIDLDTVEP